MESRVLVPGPLWPPVYLIPESPCGRQLRAGGAVEQSPHPGAGKGIETRWLMTINTNTNEYQYGRPLNLSKWLDNSTIVKQSREKKHQGKLRKK